MMYQFRFPIIDGLWVTFTNGNPLYKNRLEQAFSHFMKTIKTDTIRELIEIEYLTCTPPENCLESVNQESNDVSENWHSFADSSYYVEFSDDFHRASLIPRTERIDFLKFYITLKVVILVCLLNIRKNMLILHGASLAYQNSGYLFLAPMHGGKTTLASVFPESMRLNDDLVIIEKKGNTFLVHGHPLSGKEILHTTAQTVPVSHMFFLKKGEENKRERIDKKRILPKILENTFSLPFLRNILEQHLHLIVELFESIEYVYTLSLRKDISWHILEEILNEPH